MSTAQPVPTTQIREPRSVTSYWLVPLRLVLGGMWLIYGIPKLTPGFSIAPLVQTMATGSPAHPEGNPFGFYRHFLEQVVVPHAPIFTWLVALGEVAVGISLLLGICTRLGAVGALGLLMIYTLGQAWIAWPWYFPVYIFPHLLLIAGYAGRFWGVDSWLARKWPRIPLW